MFTLVCYYHSKNIWLQIYVRPSLLVITTVNTLGCLLLFQAVYEHHPKPKQLIVENDLPQKLQSLIEERRDGQRSGGQVLVKQMATALLKALHINTVL